MSRFYKYSLYFLSICVLLMGSGLFAETKQESDKGTSQQESQKQIQDFTSLGHFNEWEAFSMITKDEMVCWISTTALPSKSEKETETDKKLSALMVSIRLENQVRDEFSYRSQHQLDEDKPLKMVIDKVVNFKLFPQSQWAWLKSSIDESRLILSAQKGLKVYISGKTIDDEEIFEKYSLMGFTAAYKAAFDQCNSEMQKRLPDNNSDKNPVSEKR